MTDYGDHLRLSRGPSLVQPAADDVRRSLTRNSYSHNTPNVNATTQSWVHSQQNTPGPPPSLPSPIPLPIPVQRLRPLPNPHAQQRHPAALYTVNPSEPLDHKEEQARMDNIRLAYQKASQSKLRKPAASMHDSVYNIKDKKQTVIGGFVKSIRRIPKVMFRNGAAKGTTLKGDSEGTSTSVTGITTGNSLPPYVSNPPTPIVAPIPSHPHHYTHQPTRMQMPTSLPMTIPVLESSPPEVVRLDDVRRHRSDFRIMPPSVNIARSETAHFFPGTTTHSSQSTDNPTDSSSSAANTAERTTVMLYNHTPTPTPPLSRQISSNGPPGQLSYVGSEQIVRPTSFHGGSQAPPPIEIPTSRMGTPASYISYVSQSMTVPSTLHVQRSSSQLRSQLSNQSQPQSQHCQQQLQPTPPQHQPSSTPPIIELSEPMQSPISAHPQPTTDYLKMALSPPHPLQNTTALTDPTSTTHHSSSGITSFSYDPSFSKPSSCIERVFKTLYHMPWIAYERITVDYLPGKVGRVHGHALSREPSGKRVRDEREKRGGGEKRRRETRDRGKDRDGRRRKERRARASHRDSNGRLVSWYKGVSSRSKAISAELDLLSSDLGSRSSPTTTTSPGAAMGLGLEILPVAATSPRLTAAAVKVEKSGDRERRQREQKENVGDKQERTSRSRHHHHHHRQDLNNRHRGRQKRRIGSIPSPDQENGDESFNRSPSPLIPAVYPFYYPPYPCTYPYTFTGMPSPLGPHDQSQSQSQPQQDPLLPPSESPHDQTQSNNHQGPSSRTNQGQPSLSQPVLYNPGIPHLGYTAAAHTYQPMIAPSTTTMMAPQVYLLHSASYGQLSTQPLSSSGPMQNGSGVVAGGRDDGDVGVGPEVPLSAVNFH